MAVHEGSVFYRLGDFLAHEFLGCFVGRRIRISIGSFKQSFCAVGGPRFISLYPQFVAAIQIDNAGT
jgi:hypothetical protein